MLMPYFLHYSAIGLAIALGSFGTGIGQGIGAFGAIKALSRQKNGRDNIFRAMVMGLAFVESGIILALVISLLMLFGGGFKITMPIAIAELGIALAIGVASTAISISSSFAVKSACTAMSVQPFFSQKILTLMLLSQSIIETAVVFAFIISLIIRANFSESLTFLGGIKLFAAGICITLGCIGPCIGQGVFASASCRSAGLNKNAYNKIFTFSIINQAVIETPLIFCLLISIFIIYMPISILNSFAGTINFLIAGITIGLGALGTSTSAGIVASKSCYQIALEPENYSILFRTTILAQAFIESNAIYALLIAIFLVVR
ncbi:ATP synthase F0 subunit C [Candidatus Babeliales bacterium]|nr:ATP synthase F0 subunit C [Candidatus Babeliales bacterium]MCF7899155.1 ATP synthase F0 subunit C [Candidatus Babeliales bacterium]